MTVGELGRRLSAAELAEWEEFYRLEPFGAGLENWRAALVAATVANTHRGKNTRPARVADFLPKMEARPVAREQTPEAQAAMFRALVAGAVARVSNG